MKAIVVNKVEEVEAGEAKGKCEGELDHHIIGATSEGVEVDEVEGGGDEDAQEEEERPRDNCVPSVGLIDAHPLETRPKTLELIINAREAACV